MLPDNEMERMTWGWKTSKTIFQLQGNIASGKSELLTLLKDRGISVAKEPLETWGALLKINEKEGGKDFSVHKQTRISNSLSLRDFTTREMLVNQDKVVIERDLHSSKQVFIPCAIQRNRMDEEGEHTISLLHRNLEKLQQLEDRAWEGKNQCKIERKNIYLRTSPAECWARLSKRGQAGDAHLTQEDIQSLHNAHEKWLGTNDEMILVIEGNDDQLTIVERVMKELNDQGKTLREHQGNQATSIVETP